jgi:type II secretory pathway pseudopilin PulG
MELMVVIVIVAILAAVAVPLYINYVQDAQRTEAKGAIGAIITAEQVYFQRVGAYKTGMTTTATVESDLGVDLSDAKVNWGFQVNTTPGGDTDGFEVVATPGPVPPGHVPTSVGTVKYQFSKLTPPAQPWTP